MVAGCVLEMGYSRKKQTGGVEDMNFHGYWREIMWKFQSGSIKKEAEFSAGVFKERKTHAHVDFHGSWAWVLVFDLGISKGCHRILLNFQRWKLFFSEISKGKVTTLNFPGGFQKSISSTPMFVFFWNSPRY